jgi:uncharacterized membrane-anchored protein
MLFRFLRIALALIAAAGMMLWAGAATARSFKDLFPDVQYKDPKVQQLVESFDYRQGQVALGAGGVELKVPVGFYFLQQRDARRVLVEVWDNPPAVAEGVLGMILPDGKSPVEDTWGAIVTFDADGYVSDEDAASIDYDAMLKSMKEATASASEERSRNGFGTMRLIGWASPPFYDKPSHKLHWAKELQFNDSPKHTLNYDVRALGRHGVLKMNFVAGIDQQQDIKSVIPDVMAMPDFAAGSRYQDFVPGTDKVAAYGIGGLIAGKVLAKAGVLAIMLAFLKKGWILVILALGGAFRYLKGLLVRNRPPSTS